MNIDTKYYGCLDIRFVAVLIPLLVLTSCSLFSGKEATPDPKSTKPTLLAVTESPSAHPALTTPAATLPGIITTSPIILTPISSITLTPPSSTILTPTSLPPFNPTAIVVPENLNVRIGPGLEYRVLTTVDRGTNLRVIGMNASRDWFFVLLPNDQQGWVNVNYVEYNFDPTILPVVQTPATPTTRPTSPPYGAAILAPKALTEITPVALLNPYRGGLSLFSLIVLALTIVGTNSAFIKRK